MTAGIACPFAWRLFFFFRHDFCADVAVGCEFRDVQVHGLEVTNGNDFLVHDDK